MRKPDWADAPDWANWIARDKDGEWRAFEHAPSPDLEAGYHRPNGGRHEVIRHWSQTAEARPPVASPSR